MSSKKNIISAIAAACFITTFGTASVVTAADISPAATPSLNENIILAYGKKDDDKQDEHHGDHKKMKSDDKAYKHHGKCNKMSKIDTDEDGKISKQEFTKHHDAMFDKHDANKDGFLDKDEMRGMMKKKHRGHGDKQGHGHDNAKKYDH